MEVRTHTQATVNRTPFELFSILENFYKFYLICSFSVVKTDALTAMQVYICNIMTLINMI